MTLQVARTIVQQRTEVLLPYARNSRTHSDAQVAQIARVMELDPKYCDVIIRRWQSFTGKRAVLESTGQPFPESPVTEDMTEA